MEILGKAQTAAHLYTADSIFVLNFNTRDHLTGAKTLYCFPYDLCFIMIILFYPQSAFYPWSAVCSLQSAVCILPSVCILPPVCSLQSAVCSLQSAFYTDRYCWLPVQGRREDFTGLLICIICRKTVISFYCSNITFL